VANQFGNVRVKLGKVAPQQKFIVCRLWFFLNIFGEKTGRWF
jgi:hypothetical protein